MSVMPFIFQNEGEWSSAKQCGRGCRQSTRTTRTRAQRSTVRCTIQWNVPESERLHFVVGFCLAPPADRQEPGHVVRCVLRSS